MGFHLAAVPFLILTYILASPCKEYCSHGFESGTTVGRLTLGVQRVSSLHNFHHRRHQIPSPSFAFHLHNNNYRRDIPSSRSSHMMNMTGSEMPVKTEAMATTPQGVWTTPSTGGMRPRPATIHEGFSYCVDESYQGLPAWDSSTLPMHQQQQQHTPSDTVSSRPISVHQEFYPPTTLDNGKSGVVTVQACAEADRKARSLDAKARGGQLGDARDRHRYEHWSGIHHRRSCPDP